MPTPDTGIVVTTVVEMADSILGFIVVPLGVALGFSLISAMLKMLGPILRDLPEADVSDVPPPHTPRLDQMTVEDWHDFEKLYSPAPEPRKRKLKLPSQCPHCKGPANAYRTSHDEYSVICGFCGSLITGEER